MFSISEDATLVASQAYKHRCCKWVYTFTPLPRFQPGFVAGPRFPVQGFLNRIRPFTTISSKLCLSAASPCTVQCNTHRSPHPMININTAWAKPCSGKKCSERRGLLQHGDPQGVCAGRGACGCAHTAKTFKYDLIVYRLNTKAGWRQGDLCRHRTK